MIKLILLAAIVFLTTALVRVENQRYALVINMCPNKADARLPPDLDCLAKVQTRTSWVWHVYYALTD
jgi:hypothetical protein